MNAVSSSSHSCMPVDKRPVQLSAGVAVKARPIVVVLCMLFSAGCREADGGDGAKQMPDAATVAFGSAAGAYTELLFLGQKIYAEIVEAKYAGGAAQDDVPGLESSLVLILRRTRGAERDLEAWCKDAPALVATEESGGLVYVDGELAGVVYQSSWDVFPEELLERAGIEDR